MTMVAAGPALQPQAQSKKQIDFAQYGTFTPEEQAAISAKVKTIMAEGEHTQDEAVAIAVRMLYPDKSTSKNKAPLPGGNYTAIQNSDGSWTIKDVPFFAENARDPKKPVTKDWLQAYLNAALAKFQEGRYMAPIHVHHHDEFGQPRPEYGGKLLPSYLDVMEYDGKRGWTVFGDLVAVPDAVKKRIDSGELSYCSVEVPKLDEPWVRGLALLNTEEPYLRFPLITIGKEYGQKVSLARAGDPFVAFSSGSAGASVLYRLGGFTMPKGKNFAEPSKDEAAKTAEAEVVNHDAAGTADGKKEGEEPKKFEAGDIGAKLDQIIAALAKLTAAEVAEGEGAAGANLAAAADGEACPACGGTGKKGAAEPGPKDPAKEGAPAEVHARAAERAADAGKLAVLEGKLAAVEAKFTARESADSHRGLVAKTLAALKGYPLPTNVEETLLAFKSAGEVEAFASAVKATGVREPGPGGKPGDKNGTTSRDEAYPAEVQKYIAQSPEAGAVAIEQFGLFKAQGRFAPTKLERWLELKVPGILATQAEMTGRA